MIEWVEYTNHEKNVNYYNVKTGEYTDKKPNSTTSKYIDDEAGETWRIEYDEIEKSIYFVHSHSGISQWDVPKQKLEVHRNPSVASASTKSVKEHQWVESFDPISQNYYYYCLKTSLVQWEKPNQFIVSKNEEFVSSIIKVQNVFRSKSARIRVKKMKEKNFFKIFRKCQSENNFQGWIKMFDPRSKSFYYYHNKTQETQWKEPHIYKNFQDDIMINSIITIQCAYRKKKSRRKVAHQRISAKEKLELAQREAEQLYIKEKKERDEMNLVQNYDNESKERQLLLKEEMNQCKFGDRYWGVEKLMREIERQRIEEEMLSQAEEFRQKLNEEIEKQYVLNRKFEEEEKIRQQKLDKENQFHEQNNMKNIEKEQCSNGDTFWGIDKDFKFQENNILKLMYEDALSKQYSKLLKEQIIYRKWGEEASLKLHNEKRLAKNLEKKYQKLYLKSFYRAKSSESIINFIWPSKKRIHIKKYNKNLSYSSYFSKQKSPELLLNVDPDSLNPTNSTLLLNTNIFHSTDSSIKSNKNKSTIVTINDLFNSSSKISSKLFKKKLNVINNDYKDQMISENEQDRILRILENDKHKRQNIQLPSIEKKEKRIENDHNKLDKEMNKDNEDKALREIFEIIDLDHSGYINRDEMQWALSKDHKVRKLANSSIIFSSMLRKHKQNIENIFNVFDENRNGNISWDEFETQCKKIYHENEVKNNNQNINNHDKNKNSHESLEDIIKREEILAKEVFKLVDKDGSGIIDQNEMINALKNNQIVRKYVISSKALKPLLDDSMFAKVFRTIDTDNEGGISLDEFVIFCTEMTSVSILNNF